MGAERQRLQRLDRATGAQTRSAADYSIIATLSVVPDPLGTKGAVWDVAVDIRKGSPTYGQHIACCLFAPDSQFAAEHAAEIVRTSQSSVAGSRTLIPNLQFFIPRGFAHGFIVLEDNTLFSYKCDNLYCPASERGLRFDDPALNISWPSVGLPLTLSPKDQKHPLFKDIEPWADVRAK